MLPGTASAVCAPEKTNPTLGSFGNWGPNLSWSLGVTLENYARLEREDYVGSYSQFLTLCEALCVSSHVTPPTT